MAAYSAMMKDAIKVDSLEQKKATMMAVCSGHILAALSVDHLATDLDDQ
jgi:hypothetical protein